jgi:hypothetical protein
MMQPRPLPQLDRPLLPPSLRQLQLQLQNALCAKKNFLPLFPAIPNDHFVIVTRATRSVVTHQMVQLPLHPPTLRPDLRLSLLQQKQIQLAHAVLLAAQAKDPTVATPAAVGPPPYDTEYFNYYSMHLLSATTLTTDPSSLLWYMDSATSLHCTFDILDIVDPVLLPEPLPIGSANGGIIYATHSGRSHLSPLILAHYVPESKVKLIRLGALTRQRFTYNIGRDRAMTVLDPSGKHLFTCPTTSGPAH